MCKRNEVPRLKKRKARHRADPITDFNRLHSIVALLMEMSNFVQVHFHQKRARTANLGRRAAARGDSLSCRREYDLLLAEVLRSYQSTPSTIIGGFFYIVPSKGSGATPAPITTPPMFPVKHSTPLNSE